MGDGGALRDFLLGDERDGATIRRRLRGSSFLPVVSDTGTHTGDYENAVRLRVHVTQTVAFWRSYNPRSLWDAWTGVRMADTTGEPGAFRHIRAGQDKSLGAQAHKRMTGRGRVEVRTWGKVAQSI